MWGNCVRTLIKSTKEEGNKDESTNYMKNQTNERDDIWSWQ